MVCPGDIIGEMKEATIQEARQLKERKTPIGRSEQAKISQERFRFMRGRFRYDYRYNY